MPLRPFKAQSPSPHHLSEHLHYQDTSTFRDTSTTETPPPSLVLNSDSFASLRHYISHMRIQHK
eukprot:m.105317 g.105317  ORF g.105317 m.105317 type:complete len:64 (-) comp27637_c0_seq1:77-268(-)